MNDQNTDLIRTYRHVTDTVLERIRFSQTRVGDEVRIIDMSARGPGKDGMTVFKVTAPPRYSVAKLRWVLTCDDGRRVPVPRGYFEAADAQPAASKA